MQYKTELKWHSIYEEMPRLQTNESGQEFVDVLAICDGFRNIMPTTYSRSGFNTFFDTVSKEAHDEYKWNDVLYWAYTPTAKEVLNVLG